MEGPAVMTATKSELNSVVIDLPEGFTYEFRKSLIIYPTEQVNPEIAASIVGQFDREVLFNSHWVSDGPTSSLQVWAGAVAEFSSEEYAKLAAITLQKESTLRVIFFEEFLDILMKAERMFPKEKEETTKIVVSAARTFHTNTKRKLFLLLDEYGKQKKVKRDTKRSFEVEYFSQFQAYAARTAMNGFLMRKIGFLNVEVEVTESGKKFDSFVKECFMKIIHGSKE